LLESSERGGGGPLGGSAALVTRTPWARAHLPLIPPSAGSACAARLLRSQLPRPPPGPSCWSRCATRMACGRSAWSARAIRRTRRWCVQMCVFVL